MIHLQLGVDLSYEVADLGADLFFNIHAAHTQHQIVMREDLKINQAITPKIHTDPSTGNRYMFIRAQQGTLQLHYEADIELRHFHADPTRVGEVAIADLPPEVLCYLYPSRYCESDRLAAFSNQTFGHLEPGYLRVEAIKNWVTNHVRFASNTSTSTTSAIDTFIERTGVCRDFAHLMIALCRGMNLPARFATGTDYGSDPSLGPHDFHAYVEVYLGNRWYVFDPSGTSIPMGFVRLGTGRDAADVAVATIFGAVKVHSPVISTVAKEDPQQNLVLPYHCDDALSTA